MRVLAALWSLRLLQFRRAGAIAGGRDAEAANLRWRASVAQAGGFDVSESAVGSGGEVAAAVVVAAAGKGAQETRGCWRALMRVLAALWSFRFLQFRRAPALAGAGVAIAACLRWGAGAALAVGGIVTEAVVGSGGEVSAAAAAAVAAGGGGTQVTRSLVVIACIMFVVGAMLAAAETAITTLWPWKVRELSDKEGPKSPFAILETDLTRFLTTILVATTSATIFSTAIATELAGAVFGAASVAYVTGGMTIFFLFFGEILPKALAIRSPQRVARVMVPIINFLSIIVYPVGKLLASMSTLILKIFKVPMEKDGSVSEEELRLIVAGADRSGSIEKYESQIIRNVLDMEETAVRNVMCPRVDIIALADTAKLSDLLTEESRSHYSRMPVFEGTIDNIIGVVLAKSLLRYLNSDQDGALEDTTVAEIMDPPFFVPESMSVWTVLEEMRKRRLHMAIVVDEYGGTAGLVSLEDIIEEVVGEIYDEDDDVEADTHEIEETGVGNFLIDGQAELEKVGTALVLNLTEEDLRDYGTVSGFLCARMGGIPEVSDNIVLEGVRFTVIEADDRRILKVSSEALSDGEIAELAELEAQREAEAEAQQYSEDPLSPGRSVGDNGLDRRQSDNASNSGSVNNPRDDASPR